MDTHFVQWYCPKIVTLIGAARAPVSERVTAYDDGRGQQRLQKHELRPHEHLPHELQPQRLRPHETPSQKPIVGSSGCSTMSCGSMSCGHMSSPSPPRRRTPRGRQRHLLSVATDPPVARAGAAASLNDGRQSGGSERPAGGRRGTPLRLALPPRHGGRRPEADSRTSRAWPPIPPPRGPGPPPSLTTDGSQEGSRGRREAREGRPNAQHATDGGSPQVSSLDDDTTDGGSSLLPSGN